MLYDMSSNTSKLTYINKSPTFILYVYKSYQDNKYLKAK